ncbi:hypothetical protein WN943_029558 [Citrus x changshan-huyou]
MAPKPLATRGHGNLTRRRRPMSWPYTTMAAKPMVTCSHENQIPWPCSQTLGRASQGNQITAIGTKI